MKKMAKIQKMEKKGLGFSARVMIGLVLGIAAGALLGNYSDFVQTWIKPFGTLYMNGIKMIIVPLVFCSIVVGTCALDDVRKFGRIGLRVMCVYMLTTFFAVAIGVILANVTHIGMGMNLATEQSVEVTEAPSILETLINIIPSNPIAAMSEGNMLQVIAFALFVGAGIVIVGEKAKPVEHFMDGFSEVMYAITNIVMEFTPVGVFCLMCSSIASNGLDVLLPLLGFVLVVWIGFILHLVLVYCMGIRFLVGMSPVKFLKTVWEAIVVSFSTCSSSATIPVTMNCAKKLGVSLSIRSFTIPLGATVNMDGGAIYQGITALFVAHLFGVDLSLSQQIVIIITALLASIGTAGVSGASIIMLGTVLNSVGLPLEGIAIVAGVDKLIDMPRTSINIIGDLMCTSYVARCEGELNPEEEKEAETVDEIKAVITE